MPSFRHPRSTFSAFYIQGHPPNSLYIKIQKQIIWYWKTVCCACCNVAALWFQWAQLSFAWSAVMCERQRGCGGAGAHCGPTVYLQLCTESVRLQTYSTGSTKIFGSMRSNILLYLCQPSTNELNEIWKGIAMLKMGLFYFTHITQREYFKLKTIYCTWTWEN